MKALLLKDFYVLWRTMRMAMLFILICVFIPAGTATVMPILVTALLPFTCISLDEKAKWQRLQAAMPYQKREIVLSKYVLGIISVAVMSIITLLAQWLMGMAIGQPMTVGTLYAVMVSALGGTFMQAVMIPLSFRLGVEKARVAMCIFAGIVAGGMTLTATSLTFQTSLQFNGIIVAIIIGVIALLYPLSIFASMKLYRATR